MEFHYNKLELKFLTLSNVNNESNGLIFIFLLASKRSDSVNDLSKAGDSSQSRSSLAWDSIDSTKSPPGSPPPPYGKQTESENIVFNEENHPKNNVSGSVMKSCIST